jgi:hypothetical protein
VTDTNPPLWRVMRDAMEAAPTPEFEDYTACQIRAIADWLVPGGDPDADCIVPAHGRYLHTLLRAEADRAEAGR